MSELAKATPSRGERQHTAPRQRSRRPQAVAGPGEQETKTNLTKMKSSSARNLVALSERVTSWTIVDLRGSSSGSSEPPPSPVACTKKGKASTKRQLNRTEQGRSSIVSETASSNRASTPHSDTHLSPPKSASPLFTRSCARPTIYIEDFEQATSRLYHGNAGWLQETERMAKALNRHHSSLPHSSRLLAAQLTFRWNGEDPELRWGGTLKHEVSSLASRRWESYDCIKEDRRYSLHPALLVRLGNVVVTVDSMLKVIAALEEKKIFSLVDGDFSRLHILEGPSQADDIKDSYHVLQQRLSSASQNIETFLRKIHRPHKGRANQRSSQTNVSGRQKDSSSKKASKTPKDAPAVDVSPEPIPPPAPRFPINDIESASQFDPEDEADHASLSHDSRSTPEPREQSERIHRTNVSTRRRSDTHAPESKIPSDAARSNKSRSGTINRPSRTREAKGPRRNPPTSRSVDVDLVPSTKGQAEAPGHSDPNFLSSWSADDIRRQARTFVLNNEELCRPQPSSSLLPQSPQSPREQELARVFESVMEECVSHMKTVFENKLCEACSKVQSSPREGAKHSRRA